MFWVFLYQNAVLYILCKEVHPRWGTKLASSWSRIGRSWYWATFTCLNTIILITYIIYFSGLSCDRFVVQHGNVSCKNEYFYGSSCNITCSSGYKLMPIDSNSTVCQPNLMWTREPPVCERKYTSLLHKRLTKHSKKKFAL